jgi:hypothetical protein
MPRLFSFVLPLFFLICCLNPFAPGLIDLGDNQSGIITAQKTPEEVLTNFQYAYEKKDSLVYSDILDSTFLFISKNYGTSPPTNINWGRDVDLKTTGGLFRHFNFIELIWGGILDSTAIDSTTYTIKITFQLTLDGGTDIPTIRGEARFNFVRNSSDIWKIKRWDDLSSF